MRVGWIGLLSAAASYHAYLPTLPQRERVCAVALWGSQATKALPVEVLEAAAMGTTAHAW